MNTDRIKAVAASLSSLLVTAGVLDLGQSRAIDGLVGAALVAYAALAIHPPRLRRRGPRS